LPEPADTSASDCGYTSKINGLIPGVLTRLFGLRCENPIRQIRPEV